MDEPMVIKLDAGSSRLINTCLRGMKIFIFFNLYHILNNKNTIETHDIKSTIREKNT